MRPFAAVERFFERLFERPSARLFHTRIQPIQLQRRVERAMENSRLSTADRVIVPNRYLVRLAAADLHAFGDLADSLELELADAALRFARAHRYSVSDRPAVRLLADPKVDPGDVQVDASFSDAPFVDPEAVHGRAAAVPPANVVAASEPESPVASVLSGTAPLPDELPPAAWAPRRAAAAAGDSPPARPAHAAVERAVASAIASSGDDPGAPAAGIRAAGHPRGAASAPSAAAASPSALAAPSPSTPASAPVVPPSAASAAPSPPAALPSAPSFQAGAPVRPGTSAGLARLDATRTMIFEVPTVDAPLIVLREVAPDGSQRELTLDGGPVTIGRATDNNLVLRDSRVSRYHGRLAARAGALVYRDLGSTNGSRVNGVEIDEVVLGAGDRIEVGDTVLVVESVAGA